MKVLVTSGGTRIPIDRVRHIANMSQGTFGAEIAKEFLLRGYDVEFLRAERSKSPFQLTIDFDKVSTADAVHEFADMVSFSSRSLAKYHETTYKTFDDYARELKALVCPVEPSETPDIVFLAAAVSDYGTKPLKGKVRSSAADMSISLHKLPKLIKMVKKWSPDVCLVGFKLLVDSTPEELEEAARKSMKANKCDMVIANDLRDIQKDNHTLRVFVPGQDVVVMKKSEGSLAARVASMSVSVRKEMWAS
jgi:phosphopantothenate-cysteine ligase